MRKEVREERVIELERQLKEARKVIKLLAEWRFAEDQHLEKDAPKVSCEMLH